MTHKVTIKVLSRAAGNSTGGGVSSTFTNLAAGWPQLLAGYLLEALVPCHLGYSAQGSFIFLREGDRGGDR